MPSVSPIAWTSQQPANRWLPRVNNLLLVLVIITNLYVISVPFLPQLLFAIDQGRGKQQELEQQLQAAATIPVNVPSSTSVPATDGNRLVVPAMALDQGIIEGTNMYRALDQGIWRWPGGSTPDKGGNTVLLGHRFTYARPKGVFYFLDKLAVNDRIGVRWEGKTYVYTVTETKVVQPTQTEILSRTTTPTLTMYTCTPLWLPKQRLVIVAELSNGRADAVTGRTTGTAFEPGDYPR